MGKRSINRTLRARRSSVRRRRPSTAPKEKPFVRSSAPRALPEDVQLTPGRTTSTKGRKRLFWRVLFLERPAGRVYVDYASTGETVDASIDVQLNQQSRGRGIGTI